MPWFKHEDEAQIPEEMKGLTPAQIAEAIRKSKELETELSTVKDQLKKRDEEFQSTQTEFASVRDRLQAVEEQAIARRQSGDRDPNIIPSVVEDEDEAFRRRQAPIEAVALHTGSMAAQMQAQQTVRDQKQSHIWNKFEKEILDIMSKEPPARRIFPQTWLNAFTYVKGVHFDEVTRAASSGDNSFFSESAGNNTPAPAPVQSDKLSEQEEAVARKMRVDPKRYLEIKKKIKVDNDTFQMGVIPR